MFMRKDLKSESEVSFVIQPGSFWFIICLAAKMFGVPFPKVQSQVATSEQEVWSLNHKETSEAKISVVGYNVYMKT